MGKKFVRVRQPDRNDDAARPVDPEKGRAPRRGANSVAGGSLPQPKMRAVFVVVADVFREQTFQMAFIQRNDVI